MVDKIVLIYDLFQPLSHGTYTLSIYHYWFHCYPWYLYHIFFYFRILYHKLEWV